MSNARRRRCTLTLSRAPSCSCRQGLQAGVYWSSLVARSYDQDKQTTESRPMIGMSASSRMASIVATRSLGSAAAASSSESVRAKLVSEQLIESYWILLIIQVTTPMMIPAASAVA